MLRPLRVAWLGNRCEIAAPGSLAIAGTPEYARPPGQRKARVRHDAADPADDRIEHRSDSDDDTDTNVRHDRGAGRNRDGGSGHRGTTAAGPRDLARGDQAGTKREARADARQPRAGIPAGEGQG